MVLEVRTCAATITYFSMIKCDYGRVGINNYYAYPYCPSSDELSVSYPDLGSCTLKPFTNHKKQLKEAEKPVQSINA